MSCTEQSHNSIIIRQWGELRKLIGSSSGHIEIDGNNLSFAQIIYVARYGGKIELGPGVDHSLEQSINVLNANLSAGGVVYGVNTGFGAAADLRTTQTAQIQRTLTRELSYGVLAPGARDHRIGTVSKSLRSAAYDADLDTNRQQHHLPWTWVRAAMLIRINTLAKGFSAVRTSVVECMRDVLNSDIVPMIPLRGSISASGDLSPLAYIAGAIQGKSTIRVLTKDGTDVYANDALAHNGIEPVLLQAKEGLAIVNGTTISAAAGLSTLYDAHTLVLLSQILTAMSVEGLLGNPESFHPFFGDVRPHPGQIECASNISKFLHGSKLARTNDGADSVLRQDRYSIRTVPQWAGPSIEDVVLAHQQLAIECNSATDNPLVDPSGSILHGGNFQAKSVTNAMEKTRQAMQALGRMLYVQCVEMINPPTSNGLPPDLVIENPSASGTFRGTDIYISALLSELGFLASPVNSVQTAERGNQSLNSLALISARYTNTSVEVLSELAAAHLIAACQAVDLRAFHFNFLDAYKPIFFGVLTESLNKSTPNSVAIDKSAQEDIWKGLVKLLDTTVQLDCEQRFQRIAQSLRLHILDSNILHKVQDPIAILESLSSTLESSLFEQWTLHREAWILHGDASEYLGFASKLLYQFVRKTLNIPFMCIRRLMTPEPTEDFLAEGRPAPTIGQYSATLYRAIRNGTMAAVLLEILEQMPKS